MDFQKRTVSMLKAAFRAFSNLSIFVLGLLLIHQVGQAATIRVDSVNREGCTLVDAIKTANANSAIGTTCATATTGTFGDDIITFPPVPPPGVSRIWSAFIEETNFFTNGRTGLPAITSNIAIEGYGLSISAGDSQRRIFYVDTGGELTLNDIVLRHARPSAPSNTAPAPADYGGAIYNAGKLNINRSTIRNNRAKVGGGIYNSGELTIQHSQIIDNTGAGSGDVGAGIENRGTLILIDSLIQNNDAGTGTGGGVSNTAGGFASIIRTLFSMNQSTWGGGLYNQASAIVKDTTFSQNEASSLGGAVYAGGSVSTSLINTSISLNLASVGSGIYHFGGTLNLVNSLIAGNTPGSGAGAEIYRFSGTQGNQRNNLLGHGGFSNAEAFYGFGFHVSDITATRDGTLRTGLAQIISPLGNNGGPSLTFALAPGSPAIDAAVSQYGFPLSREGCFNPPLPPFEGHYRDDQRGVSRPQEGGCDIGAYEYEAPQFFVVPALNGNTVIFSL